MQQEALQRSLYGGLLLFIFDIHQMDAVPSNMSSRFVISENSREAYE